MAEKANQLTDFIQQKLLNIKNRKLAGELATSAMAEITALSSTPLLKPKPLTLSSKISKK